MGDAVEDQLSRQQNVFPRKYQKIRWIIGYMFSADGIPPGFAPAPPRGGSQARTEEEEEEEEEVFRGRKSPGRVAVPRDRRDDPGGARDALNRKRRRRRRLRCVTFPVPLHEHCLTSAETQPPTCLAPQKQVKFSPVATENSVDQSTERNVASDFQVRGGSCPLNGTHSVFVASVRSSGEGCQGMFFLPRLRV